MRGQFVHMLENRTTDLIRTIHDETSHRGVERFRMGFTNKAVKRIPPDLRVRIVLSGVKEGLEDGFKARLVQSGEKSMDGLHPFLPCSASVQP